MAALCPIAVLCRLYANLFMDILASFSSERHDLMMFSNLILARSSDAMTRRQFIQRALCWSALSNCIVANAAAAIPLHCTPSPCFPVPLSEGVWRSQEFPVGKH